MAVTLEREPAGRVEALARMNRAASGVVKTIHLWAEKLTVFLNGIAGDYIEEMDSHLAVPMAFQHEGRPLKLSPEALTRAHGRATDRVAVLIHGLCCSERVFDFPGEPGVSYGSLLQKDLGYTPYFLRYNTGVKVAENGRRLSRLLDELLEAHPEPVREILLIGHSMGGLVARSALAHGFSQSAPWTRKAGAAVYLGTPHKGAPLEKGVHLLTGLLGITEIPVAASLRDFLNFRSEAIKDLRFGRILDRGAEKTDRRFPDVREFAVAGTLTSDPRHPVSLAFGDILVRVDSARAAVVAKEDGDGGGFLLMPGLNHFCLARDRRVYEKMAAWLSGTPVRDLAPKIAPEPDAGTKEADLTFVKTPVGFEPLLPKRREPCPSC